MSTRAHGLFVVPPPERLEQRQAELQDDQLRLAHLKLTLQLELSPVVERMEEIERELFQIQMRLSQKEDSSNDAA
jgi:hypothetical protein